MDISQFRTDFPEFGSATVYPDSQVNLYLTAAANFVNACRWGAMTNLGLELWTAHNLVMAANNARAAAVGGSPGQSGSVSQKRVAEGSISYDTKVTSEEGAGMYNLTSYGKQFIHYARLFGAGPVQL